MSITAHVELPTPNGWTAEVELPAVPRTGDRLTLNGITRTVRAVDWQVYEGAADPNNQRGTSWVRIILKPNPDDV